MIRRLLIVLACGIAPLPAHAASPAFGRWLTDDRSAIVLVGPCGAQLCGSIERVLNPRAPATDINNPDPALRRRPLVGTMVLHRYSGSGARWTGGRVYDPKTGNAYRSQLTALAGGRLKVTGCIAFLCRSRIWTRAN